MHTTKNIEQYRLNELKMNIGQSASWHKDYDSAYVFIGNLNYGMNQGDIAIVFSQFGQIVDLRLVRDKQTGKPKGYAFLAYQNQKSTILTVDNFNGAQICGRTIRVDHVKRYKPPKQFLQISSEIQSNSYKPSGPDGKGWGKYRQIIAQEEQQLSQYLMAKKQKNIMLKKQINHE